MQLTLTPDNPPPDGAICSVVTTGDGVKLRAMTALTRKAKGTVVILGGRADFMERYFETARDLMDRSFSIASVDFRGQGGSQRVTSNAMRGYVNSFADYDEDLRSFMADVVLPECPPPYFLLGHSTGGNVALRAALKQVWFKKCILTSPLVDVPYGAWPVPLVRLLTASASLTRLGWVYLPGMRTAPFARGDFDGNPLTHDQTRWNRDVGVLEVSSPLGVGGPTYGWLSAAMRSFAMLRRLGEGTTLRAPTLAVLAGLDVVVDNQATRDLARRLSNFSTVTIPEAKHEILHERDHVRAQFFAVFDTFIT
jgi:lysophospholipase